MTLFSTLSFALAMLVLAASPGPGVFATVARSLSSGLRPALAVVAGIILGDIIFLLFAIFGLAVLAETLGEFFVVVKLLGGGYLIWLGLKLFFSKVEPPAPGENRFFSSRGNFLSGLLITLGNPKVILFYCGFLPTFIPLEKMGTADALIIAAVIAVVLFVVLGSYAWLASSARRFLSSPKQLKYLNRIAGSVMATAGAVIASRS